MLKLSRKYKRIISSVEMVTNSHMKKGHVTIKSASEILGVSVETLRNWDKKGKLKAKRDKNGYRIYRISELEKFAHKNKLRRPGHRIKLIV